MKSSWSGGYRKTFYGISYDINLFTNWRKKNSVWLKGKASPILLFSSGTKN
jgi:hypothetical protein